MRHVLQGKAVGAPGFCGCYCYFRRLDGGHRLGVRGRDRIWLRYTELLQLLALVVNRATGADVDKEGDENKDPNWIRGILSIVSRGC